MDLQTAVSTLHTSNTEEDIALCTGILKKLLGNLLKDPYSEVYRSVKTTNAKIKQAVVDVKGGEDILKACGFTREDTVLVVRIFDPSPQAAKALKMLERTPNNGYLFMKEIKPTTGKINCVTWLDGTPVSGDSDNTIRVHANNGDDTILMGHETVKGTSGVMSVTATPSGTLLSSGRDGAVQWNGSTVGVKIQSHGKTGRTNSQVVSSVVGLPGGTVLTCSWDTTARLWEAGCTTCVAVFEGHTQAVNAGLYLDDGVVATTSDDKTVKIWSTTTQACLNTTAMDHPQRCLAKLSSPNPLNAGFVSCGFEGYLTCHAATGGIIKTVKVCGSHLRGLAVWGRMIFTGGSDGSLYILDLEGNTLNSLAHPSGITSLAVEASSGKLFVGLENGAGIVWTLDPSEQGEGGPARMEKVVPPHSAPVSSGFEFPVEVADGRRLTIAWVSGEKPEDVAARFAAEHRIPQHEVPDIVSFVHQAQGTTGSSSGGGGGTYAFNFPVEVADGRSLTISWNPGEVPADVARRFAAQHSIPSDELGTIADFIAQAQGTPAPQAQNERSSAEKTFMANKVMELGFSEAQARQALDEAGWESVEHAINKLVG